MFDKVFTSPRIKSPLVHCITNYVTVNDCANIILACGASPVMSDEIKDCVDITSISNALLINIGTLTERTVKSMMVSAECANKKNIPIILDPVGAGATAYRTNTSLELIKNYKISLIRANMSEIKALSGLGSGAKGVDAQDGDAINSSNIDTAIDIAKNFALKTRAFISISGATDIITDGKKTFLVYNGNAKMSSITGTGCQLSALSAAYLAASSDNALESCACAVAVMGVAGDIALKKYPDCGNSSYRNYIIDEISNMSTKTFLDNIKFKVK